ncbi:poly (ADP-ribose) glycohydrolase (PARG) domain-containing protein [Ditylenchus destructor]|uniref:Poly (ADP-ribose) glycohydrolase (PARG) domain-containing protein n=1 Tax=Ditylenchus destructor TaxID=166010 RepID=A0AAD4R4H1_9BILA|nr:poly (ADP-ribose) glycohydrolase (PARG) domain-containing protein [Ditylenchus destructor]
MSLSPRIRDFTDPQNDHFLVSDQRDEQSGLYLPSPSYTSAHNEWDFSKYVPLPFYAVGDNERWRVIEGELLKIHLSKNLQLKDLMNYIKRYTFKTMGFSALRQLIEVELDSGYANHLMQTVIPKMAGLALAIHTLITQPIPLLKIGCDASVTFSQQQVACLLANAFFCTFPEELRDDATRDNFNGINFSRLSSLRCDKAVEKLNATWQHHNNEKLC